MDSIEIGPKTSETICALPFFHTYVKANGRLAACCESQEDPVSTSKHSGLFEWNGEGYRQLRLAMLRGERPERCRKCWRNEEAGAKSARMETWEQLSEQGLEGSIQCDSLGRVQAFPRFVEIKCSNLCNLRCKMCTPSSSSRLVEDQEIHSAYRPELYWKKGLLTSELTSEELLGVGSQSLTQIRVLQFSGGEPLLHKSHLAILRRLRELAPEQIELRYSTNLTVFPSEELWELWSKFKVVNLKVSLDGLGEVYNYIRLGANFEEVLENLRQLIARPLPQMTLGIGFTSQAYNIFQINEFLGFFKAMPFPGWITTHLLHDPSFLSVGVFPSDMRALLIEKIEQGPFSKLLQDKVDFIRNRPFDPQAWEKFISFTNAFEKKAGSTGQFASLWERHFPHAPRVQTSESSVPM